jgi:chromosomal replication initiation ATPase DnaA
MTTAQLILDFPIKASFAEEDFLVGASNEAAYAAIESWPAWPDPVLLLAGPEGAGKSHLSALFARRAKAKLAKAGDLTLEAVPAFLATEALVLEDMDRESFDEAALFHILNAMRARGASILLTARTAPGEWGLATPDLLSRLRLAPLVGIAAPDDMLLRAVLVKLFLDRQLLVDTGIVETILKHGERSFAMANALVARLDREAMAGRRRISRGMVIDILTRDGDLRDRAAP